MSKDLRVTQSLCQGNASGLTIDRSSKLLSLSEDKGGVDLRKGALIELVRVLDEEISAVASLETGTDEVEESSEADLERIRRVALQLGVDELENGAKVLVNDSTKEMLA